jgi:translation initiation factor 4A
MLKRGALSSASVKLLVLDEADEMLSHGFSDQIYHIVRQLSKTAQIALFSATFPPELEPLTEKFMREPLKMLVEKEVINLAGIHQYKVDVSDDSQKYFVMKDIFKSIAVSQCIIYCNSVSRVESLTRAMVEDGFPVICIHSNMPTKERQMIIEEFKRGKQRVLVSSDITARGLDVQQVSVVVNFDLPRNKHTYLHRIGRCGRWGRKGVAINFVGRRDYISLHEIENWYNIKIEELPLDYENKIRRA